MKPISNKIDKYADCELCGERYNDEDIKTHLVETEHGWRCKDDCQKNDDQGGMMDYIHEYDKPHKVFIPSKHGQYAMIYKKDAEELKAENKRKDERIAELEGALKKAQCFTRDDLTPEAKQTFNDIDKALTKEGEK